MSWLLISITLICFLAIFSEFGGRLKASGALAWWLISALLLLAAIAPQALNPLAHLLGVTLVSNLVMAATIVFLFLQTLQITALMTGEARKLRTAVSKMAAERFVERQNSSRFSTTISSPGQNTAEHEKTGHNPHAKSKCLIVLPCYNEEEAVVHLAPKLKAVCQNTKEFELDYCFVDDGSTDKTRRILQQIAPQNHTIHMANNFVSGVLLTGFHIANLLDLDFIIQCDGDGQHPVEQIPKLLNTAIQEQADLTIASRFSTNHAAHEDKLASTTPLRRSGSLLILGALKMLWPNLKCSDPTSGFRVYSAKAIHFLRPLMPDEFPEPETIALCHAHGLKIAELAVSMAPRTTGASSIGGLKAIVYMIKTLSALIGLRLRTLGNEGQT